MKNTLKKYLCYSLQLFLLSSCITNKNLDIIHVNKETNLKSYNFNYQLKSGDLLSIQISSLTPMEYDFFNKEFSFLLAKNTNTQSYMQNPYLQGYVIDENGYLKLPVLGEFYLRDKNLTEARQEIQHKAENYFSDPNVKLNILNYYVTILGAVNQPGRINIIEPNTNLLEVVGLAGDFTSVANRKKIKIIRTTGENPQVYYVDLRNKDLVSSSRFYLQPNDVVYVQSTSKRFVLIDNLPMAISTIISAFTLFYLLNPN